MFGDIRLILRSSWFLTLSNLHGLCLFSNCLTLKSYIAIIWKFLEPDENYVNYALSRKDKGMHFEIDVGKCSEGFQLICG